MIDYDVNIFIRNMKKYMDMHNENQSDIARLLDVSRSTASWYCQGRSLPRMGKLQKLADHWGVTITDLMEKDDGIQLPKNAIPMTTLNIAPVIRSVPCGYPCIAQEDIVGYLPIDVPNPQECFWLITDGDSMIGCGIQSGDKVLVRKQRDANDGDIVVCRLNGEEATLKKLNRQKDVVLLMPCNDKYSPIVVPMSDFVNGTAQIIGKVIGLMRNF